MYRGWFETPAGKPLERGWFMIPGLNRENVVGNRKPAGNAAVPGLPGRALIKPYRAHGLRLPEVRREVSRHQQHSAHAAQADAGSAGGRSARGPRPPNSRSHRAKLRL